MSLSHAALTALSNVLRDLQRMSEIVQVTPGVEMEIVVDTLGDNVLIDVRVEVDPNLKEPGTQGQEEIVPVDGIVFP